MKHGLTEAWVIVCRDADPESTRPTWLWPPLDNDGQDEFLAYPTKAKARKAIRCQTRKGYLDSDVITEVVRLF